MNYAFLSTLIVFGIVTFWLALWLSISYVAGRSSGWQKLAMLYTDSANGKPGEKKRGCIKIGKVRYKGSIVFEALPIGLRLRTLWLFRFGQQPLLVPWNEITKPEKINPATRSLIFTHQFAIKNSSYPILCDEETAEWVTSKRKEFLN